MYDFEANIGDTSLAIWRKHCVSWWLTKCFSIF